MMTLHQRTNHSRFVKACTYCVFIFLPLFSSLASRNFIESQLGFFTVRIGIFYSLNWDFVESQSGFYTVPIGILYRPNWDFVESQKAESRTSFVPVRRGCGWEVIVTVSDFQDKSTKHHDRNKKSCNGEILVFSFLLQSCPSPFAD